MRFLSALVGILALLTVAGAAVAIATDFPGRSASNDASSTATLASQAPGSTVTSTVDGEAPTDASPTAQANEPPESSATNAPSFHADVSVGQPEMLLPTGPLYLVEATYTEGHTFGSIDVRFRPGTFSADHAARIAEMTVGALAEVNEKLGTNWYEDTTVLLADQLFADDCLGCQGFTESDFRWVFMLDDGSVVPDEFEALLVHEVTHLIAGNEIHLPLDIFYVEGLAMWVMDDAVVRSGYLSPLQTTAWLYEIGQLPALREIMDDDFAGRMRKRVYYDAAGAFAYFIIERYGWEPFARLYRQQSIEFVLDRTVEEIETEWHAYLAESAGATVNGVGAAAWWEAAHQVIAGFARFYDNPSAVSSEQYRLLTLARLALNRAHVNDALSYLQQSGV